MKVYGWCDAAIKNELKKKLPELEMELMTMFEASKIQKPGPPKQQPQQSQQPQPKSQQQPQQPSSNNGPPAEMKKEPSAKTQM
jgi:hypothetical protein